jgi:hypothetical protein
MSSHTGLGQVHFWFQVGTFSLKFESIISPGSVEGRWFGWRCKLRL